MSELPLHRLCLASLRSDPCHGKRKVLIAVLTNKYSLPPKETGLNLCWPLSLQVLQNKVPRPFHRDGLQGKAGGEPWMRPCHGLERWT